jgi:Cd(II)/Pb(II)-responsive transcriptional regulator
MTKSYQIGELARCAEVPVETIRYYEREDLLPKPERSSGNFRLYSEAHRERLMFIRQCRTLDMTLAEIARLLELKDKPHSSCEQVNALLDAHIAHVASRMAELRQLKKDLEVLRRQCGSVRTAGDCAILAGLSSGTVTQGKSACAKKPGPKNARM